MKSLRNMRIQTKLIICYLTLIICLICTMGSLSYYVSSAALFRNISQTLNSIIRKSVEQIDAFLNVCDRDLREISAKPITEMAFYLSLYTKSLASVENQYKAFIKDRPYIYQIRLLTMDGNELLSAGLNKIHKTYNESQEEWFKQTADPNNIYMSDMYLNHNNQLVLTMSKLLIYDGKKFGVLAIDIKGSAITSFVDEIKTGKTCYGYIINKEGFVIAHPIKQKLLKTNILETPDRRLVQIGKNMINMQSGMGQYEYEGIKKYAAYAPYEKMKWSIAITVSDKELLAEVFKLRMTSIILGLISIMIAVIISVLIARSITKPIENLRDGAAIIGAGNLEYKIGTGQTDEIGQLAIAFDRMTENLKKITASRDELNNEIKQRKRSEEIMRELNHKLEDANNELKNFAYIASHDLREPLRTITAFGQLLAKSLENKIEPDDAENLHFILNGAKRMSCMIDGLLNYSRINTQGQEFEDVEIAKVLDEILQFDIGALISETHTKINVPRVLPAVYADPLQIRQLIQNLITNAIKYRKKDTAAEITITGRPAANGMVRLEIADNGIGIPPEYHNTIFGMFKRLPNVKDYEGTGIGLAVCKRIIQRHNGQIGVESQPDKGSTFWFTVPAAKTQAVQSANTVGVS